MTQESKELSMDTSEMISVLPVVLDAYNQKKKQWAKEGLSKDQQLKTARHLNQVLSLIGLALKNGYQNGLRHTLYKHARRCFPQASEKLRVFGMADELLRFGDEALQKVCSWYEAYPEVYEEKFALNKAGIKFDKLHQFFKKDVPAPCFSFMPLAQGENPVLSRNSQVFEKVLATKEINLINGGALYQRWLTKSKAGKKYSSDRMVCSGVLHELILQAHDTLAIEEKALKSQREGR